MTLRPAPVLALAAVSSLVGSLLACDGEMGMGTIGDPPVDGRAPIGDASTRVDASSPPGTDAATPAIDGGVEDSGGPAPTGTPLFVAQGHAGRTVVSCDDGMTWEHDQSLDDTIRCFDGIDCDHHEGAAKGITYGAGYFYTTWGWGEPGGIRRSRDGVSWEEVLPDTSYGGVAYGNDVLVGGGRNSKYSTDQGDGWSDDVDTGLTVWNVRRAGFGTGVFVLAGSSGTDSDLVMSADAQSWFHADSGDDPQCWAGIQTRGGIAAGGGTLVVLGSSGVACSSTDGGRNWASATVSDSVNSQLVWTGTEFMAWSRGQVHRSPDGVSWTSETTSPDDLDIGAVAHGDGTFVAVNAGWQRWYEDQVFYRSNDGVSWEALPAGAYTGGHPIRFIGFGYAEPGGACD